MNKPQPTITLGVDDTTTAYGRQGYYYVAAICNQVAALENQAIELIIQEEL